MSFFFIVNSDEDHGWEQSDSLHGDKSNAAVTMPVYLTVVPSWKYNTSRKYKTKEQSEIEWGEMTTMDHFIKGKQTKKP